MKAFSPKLKSSIANGEKAASAQWLRPLAIYSPRFNPYEVTSRTRSSLGESRVP